MIYRKLLVICFSVAVMSLNVHAYASVECGEPVETTSGLVQGMSEEGTCAWKGIPYAAPPLGDLRWRAPEDYPAEEGVRSAVEFSPQCPQQGFAGLLGGNNQPVEGDEDCLYLNIWRPAKEGKYPVMVWIHGGALILGSGSAPHYQGKTLSGEKDVVLVTINYRLGPLGFLSIPEFTEEDPHGGAGNYGLLDQVKALEWVSDNIQNFGGDPDNVTIFGESAGGWSVCNLLACPLARGLFHKAIIQSGACNATMSLEEGYAYGKEFAAEVGCEGPDAADCLRNKTVDEVFSPGSGVSLSGVGDRLFMFIPKEDGHALKDTPIEVLRSGKYNSVPLMVGSNRDEVKFFTFMAPGIRLYPRQLFEGLTKDKMSEAEFKKYRELYPTREYRRSADAWIDAMGDNMLGCPCFEAAEASALVQKNTYYYRFDFDDSRYPHMLGAAHALDVPFVFGTMGKSMASSVYSFDIYNKKQVKKAQPLMENMIDYWVNFARTGDPNGPGLNAWPAYTIEQRQRMHLDVPQAVRTAEDYVKKCTL